MVHGTVNTYTRHGCRCEACCAAKSRYRRQRHSTAESKMCECGVEFHRLVGEGEKAWRAHVCCSKACAGRIGTNSHWVKEAGAVGTRTLLARTCKFCGAFLPGDAFRRDSRYGIRSFACDLCRGRRTVAGWSQEKWEAARSRRKEEMRQRARRTRATARRGGYEWTGPELEIAARDDLTVMEMALMLGRSYNAVIKKRGLLRRDDPRTVNLAGV